MATNNAVNLKDSGIAKYDGAGTFSAGSIPLTVPDGGLGSASYTPYAVLIGNGTGAVQTIASLGSSTNVLISNGPSSAPTMQAIPTIPKVTFQIITQPSNPSDSTTYSFFNNVDTTEITSSAKGRIYVPVTGTINYVKGYFSYTNPKAGTITMRIRHNDTTDYDITTTMEFTSSPTSYETTSLGLAVTAGDFIQLQMICPVWSGTNPTLVQSTHVIEVS